MLSLMTEDHYNLLVMVEMIQWDDKTVVLFQM